MFWKCAQLSSPCCQEDSLVQQKCCAPESPLAIFDVRRLFAPAEVQQEAEEDDVENSQMHVWAFYKELSADEKLEFSEDWRRLEKQFGECCHRAIPVFMDALRYGERVEHGDIAICAPHLMNWETKKFPPAMPGANMSRIVQIHPRKRASLVNTAFNLYTRGGVGIVLLVGGLDGRMGDGMPKGCMDIGLVSGKSIFQVYVERVRRLQHMIHRRTKIAVEVPWYIMCNRDNIHSIEDFFDENDYFGLLKKDFLFFVQSYFPALDKEGKFMLEEKHKVMEFPNGNGAMFRDLVEDGIISDMKTRNVRAVYVSSIDNLLAKIGDPLFIGYCHAVDAQCGMKCVEKMDKDERLGVLCSKIQTRRSDLDGDGVLDTVVKLRAAVFEYFELSEENKKKKDAEGSRLEFHAGNLSQYYFTVQFVLQTYHKLVPKHLIPKKLSYVDLWTGEEAEDEEKDSFRIEGWIFDAFEYASRVVGLEVPRTEHAFIKNRVGNDSPETAVQTCSELHQGWILVAGGIFKDNQVAGEQSDSICEISPLVSYDGEDLEQMFFEPIQLPYYLCSHMELVVNAAALKASGKSESHYFSTADSRENSRQTSSPGNSRQNSTQEIQRDSGERALDYLGERATPLELLPPTPREVDFRDLEQEERERQQEEMELAWQSEVKKKTQQAQEEAEGARRLRESKAKGVEDDWGVDLWDESVAKLPALRDNSREQTIYGPEWFSKQAKLSKTNWRSTGGAGYFRNTGRNAQGVKRSEGYWQGDPAEESLRGPTVHFGFQRP